MDAEQNGEASTVLNSVPMEITELFQLLISPCPRIAWAETLDIVSAANYLDLTAFNRLILLHLAVFLRATIRNACSFHAQILDAGPTSLSQWFPISK